MIPADDEMVNVALSIVCQGKGVLISNTQYIPREGDVVNIYAKPGSNDYARYRVISPPEWHLTQGDAAGPIVVVKVERTSL